MRRSPAALAFSETFAARHGGGPPPPLDIDALNPATLVWKGAVVHWLAKQHKAIAPELTRSRKKELRQLFDILDADGSGALDQNELETALRICGYGERAAPMVEEMFRVVGKTSADSMGFFEFLRGMSHTAGDASAGASSSAVSFSTLLAAFKRKRLLTQAIESDDAQCEERQEKGEADDRGSTEGNGEDD